MKRHVIWSLLMALGLVVTPVWADEDAPTEGSGSSSSGSSSGSSTVDAGEDGDPGDAGGLGDADEPAPDGEDGVISRPSPEPAPDMSPPDMSPPDMSPEEEELIAYRAELAERIEAGELTLDEAQELFEELAQSLGFRAPDDVIDIDIDEIDERERLLDDFRQELDLQVQAGELSPDEAEAQLIDFLIELGFIETVDGGRPVEPAEPPPLPQIDPETSLRRFEEILVFLAENEALTTEQVREQIDVFAEFLENGEEVTLPHPDMNLSMDQAELVYIARDLSMWYAPDEFETKDLQQELLHIAMSLGIIEGGEVTPIDPGPEPNPYEERLLALREDLNRQVEEGTLTEEEAKQLYYDTAVELGLIDEDGTVVILPAPGTPPIEPRPMPPEYQPTPAELEMMELLRELAVLIEQGELTADEAWALLAETAGEEGWDIDFASPDSGAPEPVSERDADDSGVLLALRSNLASQVDDDGLSGSEAWDELTQALDSQEEDAGGQGTAIRATSWGAVKAAIR